MKKISLILTGLFLGSMGMMAQDLLPAQYAPRESAPAYADAQNGDQLLFGYCGNTIATGFGTYAGSHITALIEIPEEMSKSLQGNRLTKIRVGTSGPTAVRTGIAVVSKVIGTNDEDEGNKPFLTQNFNLRADSWNEVVLNDPWTIDGEKFYVGYQVTTVGSQDYPIGCDRILPDNLYGDIVVVDGAMTHCGEQFGNLCIQMVVEGDNLPQYDVQLRDFVLNPYYSFNDPFSINVTVINKGVKEFDNLDLEVSVNNTPIEVSDYTLTPSSIAPGESGTLTISNLRYNEEVNNVPVTLNITKVNGEYDATPLNNTVTGSTSFVGAVYPKAMVLEEWTGTWCGWCVRGIVGMNYMTEKYGNKGFIGIAVHDNDEMCPSNFSYKGFLTKYADSYPGAQLNRSLRLDPTKELLETLYLGLKDVTSPFMIKAYSTYDKDNGGKVFVNAKFKSSISLDMALYRLAVVIIEDEVGPYPQNNAYAGGGSGPMDGWEDYPTYQYNLYNDVARDISSWTGDTKSLPTKIVKGELYDYEGSVSTRNVSKIDNAHLVILLLDTSKGTVLNAWRCPINGESPDISDNYNPGNDDPGNDDPNSNGVGNVSNANVFVNAEAGAINIAGDYVSCSIYGFDGSLIKTVSGKGRTEIGSGAYIVHVTDKEGKTATKKVIVK